VGCNFQEFFGSSLESAINVRFSVTIGDALILLLFHRPNMNLHYFTFAHPLLYTYKFVIGPYTLKLSGEHGWGVLVASLMCSRHH
jgi:hypothetical protein